MHIGKICKIYIYDNKAGIYIYRLRDKSMNFSNIQVNIKITKWPYGLIKINIFSFFFYIYWNNPQKTHKKKNEMRNKALKWKKNEPKK